MSVNAQSGQPFSGNKARIALVFFDSLGDGLIYLMIANNLQNNDFNVTCYGNVAYQTEKRTRFFTGVLTGRQVLLFVPCFRYRRNSRSGNISFVFHKSFRPLINYKPGLPIDNACVLHIFRKISGA
jgi:hypothetical protein